MFFIFAYQAQEGVCKGVRIVMQDSSSTAYLRVEDIEKTLKVNKIKLEDKKLDTINTYRIGKLIERNPVVRSAHCYKTPSGYIRIDVSQRTPILRISGVEGNYYVDEEGYKMPATGGFAAYVPVASGYVSKELATGELLDFARFLNSNRFWGAQIEQIYVTQNGEVELIPRVGNHTILLGKLDGYEKKLDNLLLFYHKGIAKKGWNTYKAINLKFENQVVGVK
jgi:cell division protein FtsQ